MKRTIIKIDEELCNGCGQCVAGCHEGALQLIDGKAVMVSELYCDGLGACIGECPIGAITLEEREAEPYNEALVMERLMEKGENVILAHFNHLKEHKQTQLLNEGLAYLKQHHININFSMENKFVQNTPLSCGCPGNKTISFDAKPIIGNAAAENAPSQLQQWPVQLHLLSPYAPYLSGCDLLLAADCVAFSVGNFHAAYLRGKRLAIACPKLDSNKEAYVEKLATMLSECNINTLTVMIMEVPCCSALLQIAQLARQKATRNVPLKLIMVSLQGERLSEEWI